MTPPTPKFERRVMGDKEKAEVLRALKLAVGGENASGQPAINAAYVGSANAFPRVLPDFVVRPRHITHLQAVLKVANFYRIPVTPVASGTWEPSTHPLAGGILLDLMSMDQIIEINAEGGYAVVEPGVTAERLAEAVGRAGFRLAIAAWPPGISILGNYILRGDASMRSCGVGSDIVGLEVVLPDGTVFQTGSKAFSGAAPEVNWFADWGPLPDLRGLYLNACGTLGVITKAAVRIYPLNEARAIPLVGFSDFASGLNFMQKVVRNNLVEHVSLWHWGLYSSLDLIADPQQRADEIKALANREPWLTPDVRPYVLATPIMSGFREDIMNRHSICGKVAVEFGGHPFQEEFRERFPKAWNFMERYALYHKPNGDFMRLLGLGWGIHPALQSSPGKAEALEDFILHFWHSRRMPVSYQCHALDQGRSFTFRIAASGLDPAGKEDQERASTLTRSFYEEALQRFGAVGERYNGTFNYLTRAGAEADVFRRIKRTLDPYNILNPGLDFYGAQPEAEKEPDKEA